jgi:hypothetical protein
MVVVYFFPCGLEIVSDAWCCSPLPNLSPRATAVSPPLHKFPSLLACCIVTFCFTFVSLWGILCLTAALFYINILLHLFLWTCPNKCFLSGLEGQRPKISQCWLSQAPCTGSGGISFPSLLNYLEPSAFLGSWPLLHREVYTCSHSAISQNAFEAF